MQACNAAQDELVRPQGAGGVIAYQTITSYDGSRAQTIFETVTYLLAATVLTYMTFWMQAHSRTMTDELRRRSDVALNRYWPVVDWRRQRDGRDRPRGATHDGERRGDCRWRLAIGSC